ncbi:MAG: glycosyltransferase [Rubrivivax sp.]|nr:glycosyltransferase [Rubrivivax sp.]
MRRIGITAHTFVNWAGGLDFVRTVASGLRASGEPLELHLLMPIEGPWLRTRTTVRAWRDALLRRTAPPQPAGAAMEAAIASFGEGITVHRIDIGHTALRQAAAHLGLQALIPALKPLPFGAELPWVGYVWDFQHRHLPQLFKPRSIARRDREFRRMLLRAPSVIVNSRAVADDVKRFVPEATASVWALPFSAEPQPEWFEPLPGVHERHGIRGRYFIVCNQFWQHKDHGTAFRAMAELVRSHPDVQMVCTGATSDFRDAGYFDRLMAEARSLGIDQHLKVLGLVPKREQIALLAGAVALVQPTLSEGGPGGGAAYDAVSLGVPALLSDIAVNREIEEPEVGFFQAGDAASLAAAMRGRLDRAAPLHPGAATLLAEGRQRRRRAGQVLLQAVDAACLRRP